MNPVENFESVEATQETEFKKPTAGGYICMILDAEDVAWDELRQKGSYLKMKFDIANGDFVSYYTDLSQRFGNWSNAATFIRSYKESAMGFFKQFIVCVEQSNPGYKWNWDEKSLNGKFIGLVLAEEEYEYNGEIKTRLKVDKIKTVKDIQDGNFTVPAPKKLATSSEVMTASNGYAPVSSDELPF